jgi:hypothetical protein
VEDELEDERVPWRRTSRFEWRDDGVLEVLVEED